MSGTTALSPTCMERKSQQVFDCQVSWAEPTSEVGTAAGSARGWFGEQRAYDWGAEDCGHAAWRWAYDWGAEDYRHAVWKRTEDLSSPSSSLLRASRVRYSAMLSFMIVSFLLVARKPTSSFAFSQSYVLFANPKHQSLSISFVLRSWWSPEIVLRQSNSMAWEMLCFWWKNGEKIGEQTFAVCEDL